MVTALKKISVAVVAFLVLIVCSNANGQYAIGNRQKAMGNEQWAIGKKYRAKNTGQKIQGNVNISFINMVNDAPLILDSNEYTNPFGEVYRVSKLKYYISNIKLNSAQKSFIEPDSYHLIDAADTASLHFSFDAAANNYNSISFIIGVDSIKNVSGAQSGALDPTNGMFWTWNSGYVFFKLEGISPASTIINNRIEYHIGGFAGANNALQYITLPLPANEILKIQEGKSSNIIIETDINKLWQGANDLKIATTPATMTPGILSKKIAANYSSMFTIKTVNN
ncbi:MAG: MbnP family protein [Ferruginibacter sp.]